MTWYLFILAMLFFLTLLSLLGYCGNEPIIIYVTVVISLLMLLFFMGFRDVTVGADTYPYQYNFKQIGKTELFGIFGNIRGVYGNYLDFEYGYRLYNKILFFFSQNKQAITFMNSAIIIGLLGLIFHRASAYPFLSVWLYVTLGTFQTQMNVARNGIAILICYLGICALDPSPRRVSKARLFLYRKMSERDLDFFVIKRKRPNSGAVMIFCLLLILTGATFHVSVLLFLPFCLFAKDAKMTFAQMRIWIIAAIIFGIATGYALTSLSGLGKLIPMYANYFDAPPQKLAELDGLILGAFHFLLLCFVLFFADKSQKHMISRNESVGLWMLIAEAFSFSASIRLLAAARVAALFGPYLMISIPNMLFWGIRSRRKRLWVIIALILLSGAQYVLRLMVNNIGATLPYTFFWT